MDEKGSKNIKGNDELIRLRGEVVDLKKKLELAEAHREILKNSPPGHRFPMQRNSLPLHWLNA
jgi:hypothetical protein